MEREIKYLNIEILVLELTKFTEMSRQKRWDIIHCKRPIPTSAIRNYENALQKELDQYIQYGNWDKHSEEVYQWQQNVVVNALEWNYSLKLINEE